jgi:FAD/FMN-containing dehydrogenase
VERRRSVDVDVHRNTRVDERVDRREPVTDRGGLQCLGPLTRIFGLREEARYVTDAGAAFAVLAEVDGTADAVAAGAAELKEALSACATATHRAQAPRAVAELWRWRKGVGVAADAALGGTVSEDIAVPVEQLGTAVGLTQSIGRAHGLDACTWGHAGDGNLHSTFLFDHAEAGERAQAAARELFAAAAAALGGSSSGEHGIRQVKNEHLRTQWASAAVRLHGRIKEAFDPRGLLNPGEKLA